LIICLVALANCFDSKQLESAHIICSQAYWTHPLRWQKSTALLRKLRIWQLKICHDPRSSDCMEKNASRSTASSSATLNSYTNSPLFEQRTARMEDFFLFEEHAETLTTDRAHVLLNGRRAILHTCRAIYNEASVLTTNQIVSNNVF